MSSSAFFCLLQSGCIISSSRNQTTKNTADCWCFIVGTGSKKKKSFGMVNKQQPKLITVRYQTPVGKKSFVAATFLLEAYRREIQMTIEKV